MNHAENHLQLLELAGALALVAARTRGDQWEQPFFTRAAEHARLLADWSSFPIADEQRLNELHQSAEDLIEITHVLARSEETLDAATSFWVRHNHRLRKLRTWFTTQIQTLTAMHRRHRAGRSPRPAQDTLSISTR